jgi:hypothetical protein
MLVLIVLAPIPAYYKRSFAAPVEEDDANIRKLYRHFTLSKPSQQLIRGGGWSSVQCSKWATMR